MPRSPRRTLSLVALLGAALCVAAVILLPSLLDPWALPSSDWKTFRQRFITPAGRVVDDANGRISHSEGQGYAMLLAVAFGDRGTFERLWKWTRDQLQTRPKDKLLSWRWEPASTDPAADPDQGRVTDPNNASDGDLLVAWALYRGAAKWRVPEWNIDAARITDALRETVIVPSPRGPILLPGQFGFSGRDPLVINPSYYVFPALFELALFENRNDWRILAKNGLQLIIQGAFGPHALSPDWLQLEPELGLPRQWPPVSGYNAVRVPLYVAWASPKSPVLEGFAAWWDSLPPTGPVPAEINLADGRPGPHPALPGMLAIRQLTLASVHNRPLTVREIPAVDQEESYYSAVLKLLTKLATREAFQAPAL